MTEKRFIKKEYPYDWWFIFDKKQEYCEDMKIPFCDVDNLIAMSEEHVVDLLNELNDENEQLKSRFHRERELAMRLSRECDALTIKKQELELEIIRLEEIIKTGKR